MIHIVFNAADVETLEKAIEMDESLKGEVLQVKDDFAVGPLQDIFSEVGIVARSNWWAEILANSEFSGLAKENNIDDPLLVSSLKEKLNADEKEVLWIWAAQNKHDVSGYYWLMSQLKDYQGRVYILYLNNLPFINEKGQIFYPEWLSQIPPKEFIKAKKLARPITLSEFEVDPDEWARICNEGKMVRILEGGKKLVQFDEDYYDATLLKHITADWQKASKVIHHFLSKNKNATGDAYLLWRLKKNISEGSGFDVQGELKGMKDFEIKSKVAEQV
ncbi:DUF1835 domain-containing protein [Pollutibacter soli]|uniref:DUF1835 domain-containing protein n=1 Tax=Pollutibacter soli TaxID=3034157 RepID=UPI00301329EA